MTLVDQILALTAALTEAEVPHAIGGAIALAYCVEAPRATIDIDCNVFVDVKDAADVLAVLPAGVEWDAHDVRTLEADGQARLWWGDTPVDLFLNTTAFHEDVAMRIVRRPLADGELPLLSCQDLAVFKAFFDRTKDWADLEAMAAAGALDVAAVTGVLVEYLGPDDPRIARVVEVARADADPDADSVVGVRDGTDGAWDRANLGRRQADAGDTVALEDL